MLPAARERPGDRGRGRDPQGCELLQDKQSTVLASLGSGKAVHICAVVSQARGMGNIGLNKHFEKENPERDRAQQLKGRDSNFYRC